jgi:hypothetical protein
VHLTPQLRDSGAVGLHWHLICSRRPRINTQPIPLLAVALLVGLSAALALPTLA